MAYLPTIEEVDELNKVPAPHSPRASLNPNQKYSSSTGFMYDRNRGSPPLGRRKHNVGDERLSAVSDTLSSTQRYITHSVTSNITLMEDCFGLYMVNKQTPIKVFRFTWRSSDDVVVQLITYGARIITMKYPDKDGASADVVLGFQDLAGYLYYDQYYIGATIGAVTDKIKQARFELDGKHVKVTENDCDHYFNGGAYGLDKVIWNSCVINNKVVLTHVIPHKHEGLPGPVMIKITYELSEYNEFHINMEAKSGRPTIINLSNLCYFNLGGHSGGSEELKKHSVTINCNCYTLMDDDDLPTGKIMSVAHTRFDFMKPKLMKDCLGM
ncbi:aldose-1-epimerase [Holotrichia oblita]|uniref:Aldose-1-epimerase n=2 Tax=Holotrichia oblita TaxID=644536 RepID=A0ACB9SQP9_HOLOL|nr:aldose-1-epimerase [Holotrichia oblita]KAI4456938.1 aldose-1-epimerase [Holotrichia oblita]